MKKNFLLTLLCLYLTSFITAVQGQGDKIEGIVLNEQNEPLEAASIVLLQAQDSVMSGFAITDEKGRFRIIDVQKGSYILRTNFLGFQTGYIDLKTKEGERNIDLGEIVLVQGDNRLDEITIKAYQVPIRMRQDTIEYNAGAFKVMPNDVVEDLLKKMPGIEVDKNGTIKAQGEQVNKVLVEGKEFFGNDPSIATKNLSADAVDKVQVFDKKSEMAEFSGIDDGQEQKTINLVLKDGKKSGFFGKGSAGYGTEERYDAKFNINRFGVKTQFSAIGMGNNINEQGFSIMDYIDFMGGFGNMLNSGGGEIRLDSDDLGVPIGGGLDKGFVDTRAGGLNYNIDLNKNTEFSSSYFFSQIETDITQSSFKQGLLEEESYETVGNSDRTSKNTAHKLNLNLKNKLDSSQWITASGNISWNDGFNSSLSSSETKGSGGSPENQTENISNASGSRLRYGLNTNYNKRFGKSSRIFTANFRINNQNKDNEAFINSLYTLFPSMVNSLLLDTTNQQQILNNDQVDYLLAFSYTQPLNKRRYLEWNYSRQNYDSDYDKIYYDILVGGNNQRVLNSFLSQTFQRQYTYDRFGTNFKINRKKYSLTLGAKFQRSQLEGTLGDQSNPIEKTNYNLLPLLRMNFDMSNSNSLRINYQTSIREPSLEQLQPTLDNSDPLNLYQGNPDLKTEYSHRLRLNYHSFSAFTNIAFFASMNATYTRDKITNSQAIDEFFVQTIRPVNVPRDWRLNSYVSFSSPLRFVDMKVNLNTDGFFNRGFLFINNQMNETDRWNTSIEFSLENRKKQKWDWLIGTSVRYNLTKYSESSELNQDFLQTTYFADLSKEFEGGWYFKTSMDFTRYSQEAFGSETDIPLWKASVSKNFLKGNKGQLEIAVVDILDKNKGIDRVSNLNYTQESRILTLSRYLLVKFHYSFSGFGKKNKGGIHMTMDRRR